jgi:uncharacterized protein YdeI (YjbR/CyaY-like superfamily)
MAIKDKRIDDYIAKAQPFAQPVLKRLRKLVHKACPEVQETIKWGFASFYYEGPLCSMASFKQHCVFGFWKSSLLKDPDKVLSERHSQGGEAMGNLGRVTGLKDLPEDKIIMEFIRQAMKLNEDGVKLPPKKKISEAEKKAIVIPAALSSALKKNKKAKEVFDNFSYSHRKEYAEWINEAKTDPTRDKRVAQTIEWLAEGKSRNWKYVKKKKN